jgi:hypothetical protein
MGTKPHQSPISTLTLDQCHRLIALLIEG